MENTDNNAEKYFDGVCKNSESLSSLTEQQRNEVLTCLVVYAGQIDKQWTYASAPPEKGRLVLINREHDEDVLFGRYTNEG